MYELIDVSDTSPLRSPESSEVFPVAVIFPGHLQVQKVLCDQLITNNNASVTLCQGGAYRRALATLDAQNNGAATKPETERKCADPRDAAIFLRSRS